MAKREPVPVQKHLKMASLEAERASAQKREHGEKWKASFTVKAESIKWQLEAERAHSASQSVKQREHLKWQCRGRDCNYTNSHSVEAERAHCQMASISQC